MSERGYEKEGVRREKKGKEGKGKEWHGPIYFVVLKEIYSAVAVAG